MGVIAQHQLSTFASPVAGATPIDANTVRGNDNTVKTAYNAHDADATIHLQNGLVGSRPAASIAGQTWLATDTGAVYAYLDTGSAWVEVNYMRNTGGTITGNVVITGTLGVTGVATFTAQPILSSLTASQAVFSDGSKGLVSNAITGTGNVVMSASPTLTGTLAMAAFTASGNGSVTGYLQIGTAVTTGVTAGDVVLANAKSIRAAVGTTAYTALKADANGYLILGGGIGGDLPLVIWGAANGSLPAAGAAQTGMIALDTTNNRLCYWLGASRYYLPVGTSF